MGLFDYFRSSYDLGEHFTNTICQTKTIDDFGGSMSFYWLSPSGELYYVDERYVSDFVEIKEGEEGYNDKLALFNFQWVPNGNHGKVSPYITTRYVEIYPENWKGKWEYQPRLRLHFKTGILQDFEDITGSR